MSVVEREASANPADNVNETDFAENAPWTDQMGAVSGSEGTSETSFSSILSVLGRYSCPPTGKVSPKPLGGAQTDGPRCPTNLLKRRLLGGAPFQAPDRGGSGRESPLRASRQPKPKRKQKEGGQESPPSCHPLRASRPSISRSKMEEWGQESPHSYGAATFRRRPQEVGGDGIPYAPSGSKEAFRRALTVPSPGGRSRPIYGIVLVSI